jgi:hypothetical protein
MGEWSASGPGRFLLPGKGPPRYPLHRRLGALQSRPGQEATGKILSPLPGIEPRSPGGKSHVHVNRAKARTHSTLCAATAAQVGISQTVVIVTEQRRKQFCAKWVPHVLNDSHRECMCRCTSSCFPRGQRKGKTFYEI